MEKDYSRGLVAFKDIVIIHSTHCEVAAALTKKHTEAAGKEQVKGFKIHE